MSATHLTTKLSLLAAAAAVSFSGSAAFAASVTWDGGPSGTGTSWNDPTNWGGDSLPALADTAVFTNNGGTGVSTTKTISLDAPQSIYQLNIPDWANTPNFTIGAAADVTAGNTLTLSRVYRGDNVGNTLTIAANVVLAEDSLWTVYKGFNGGVTVTGSIGGDGRNLTVMVPNGGNLTFSGANTYTGATILNSGTLTLSFASKSTNILSSSSTLSMGGGALALSGKANTTASQTVAGLTLNPGASSLSISNNATANPTLLSLGAITHNAGGTINFTQPSNGSVGSTNGYATSTGNDASGILGAYATVGGNNWASNNGTNIVAYTGYADLATASISDAPTSNVRVTSATTGDVAQSATVTTINTLAINDAAARTITIGSGNTLRLGAMGGILSTGTGGATIGAAGNAGSLTAGGADDTAGELVFNNSTAAALNATVVDNGTGKVAFTKTGGGTLTMNGAHTYTGGTFVNAGTLSLTAASNPLSTSGNITVSGGTLAFAAGSTQSTSGEVAIRGGTLSGGTLTKSGTAYDGRAGTVSTILAGSVGLTKTGPGALTLSANNTYSGTTTVLAGSLSAASGAVDGEVVVGSASGGSPASLSGSSSSSFSDSNSLTVYANGSLSLANNESTGPIIVNGGYVSGSYISAKTITMTGGEIAGGTWYNPYASTITVNSSASTARISGALELGSYYYKTITVADGTAAIDLLLTKAVTGSGGGGNFTKNGDGVMKMEGANTFTAPMVVNGGTLWIGSAGTLNSPSSITVNNAAVLQYDGATALTKLPTLNNTATFIYNSPAKLGGNITIAAGRTLGGSGTLANVTVNGLLKPGNSPGQLTVDSLTLGSTATTTMEVGGATLGTQYDNLTVAGGGALAYGGTLNVVSYGTYDLAQVGEYSLFSFTSTPTGDFSAVNVGALGLTGTGGVWTGTNTVSGTAYTYTFTDSTGVLAVTIPEPATAGFLLVGAALGLCTRRTRRGRMQ